jgi:phosphohistidine phosphatase
MIRLYLVRHAIAVDTAQFSGDDADRPLTDKGRLRFRRCARAFARLGDPIDLLATSPLVRAVQTAEMLATALPVDDVESWRELAPPVDPERVLSKLARSIEDGQGAVLVGHDPGISLLLARVAELSPDDAQRVAFKKGAIVRVDVGALPSARPAQARWWLSPKTRELVHGLPLEKRPETEPGKKPAR